MLTRSFSLVRVSRTASTFVPMEEGAPLRARGRRSRGCGVVDRGGRLAPYSLSGAAGRPLSFSASR
eukprot:5443753-Alexandrium_andersonii.AAC.1